MTTVPHAAWAEVYDLAYEESFGPYYDALTNETLEQVAQFVRPPGRIVDFGAGTGRLSVPLANRGYHVTAVEPCIQMIAQLQRKSGASKVDVAVAKMQDFRTRQPFDMALCVFTVLLYLLDEDSLLKSMQAAAAALRPGGLMLIDLPSRATFRSYQRNTEKIDRRVKVIQQEGDMFTYEEYCAVKDNDGRGIAYTDSFKIRYWHRNSVTEALARSGFAFVVDLSASFVGTGSEYILMRKLETNSIQPAVRSRMESSCGAQNRLTHQTQHPPGITNDTGRE